MNQLISYTMSSTSPTRNPPHSPPASQHEQEQEQENDSSTSELRQLLRQRDQEICALKFELEKYKLALKQSQLNYHQIKQQLSADQPADKRKEFINDDNDPEGRIESEDATIASRLLASSSQSFIGDNNTDKQAIEDQRIRAASRPEGVSDTTLGDSSISKEPSSQQARLLNRLSVASLGSSVSGSSSRGVHFKTGHNDDHDVDDEHIGGEDDKGDDGDNIGDLSVSREDISEKLPTDNVGTPDEIHDIIQDVGEIDLELELRSKSREHQIMETSRHSSVSGHSRVVSQSRSIDEATEDGDMISDELLTSLTDAAINNLSQLAALQERCESHQHSQQQQQHPTQTARTQQQSQQLLGTSSRVSSHSGPSSDVSGSTRLGPIGGRSSQTAMATTPTPEPFSQAISHAANIQAATAAAVANMNTHSQQTNSSSSSISPNSTIQADLSSSHSLANVVAAAAAAAAAANDQHNQQEQQQQHQHRPAHQLHSTPQSRLISSALASPEFYHSLQQHQHSHAHQTGLQPQISPISSLHYSPSTSITPSPSSLLAQSRRSASNTSSSLLSPIASPNYLKRQFMPDRMPMLSPSPTSLTTGSSSGASSGLAHLLQQQHSQHRGHQQRSASALAGPISSLSGSPLSGTGSSAVSPLLTSKNSSQARLNNMQIRHKFGYLGSGRAQFNSPHGFCLGLNQEIVVADTNNHRVCIFDKDGTYITQFGSPGKEEGQLWNPRKVAILHRPTNSGSASSGGASSASLTQRHGQLTSAATYSSHFASGGVSGSSGSLQGANIGGSGQFGSEPLYVVCDRGAERSRMQLFTKDGAFIKKIGIHYIDIVAGLAITQNGLIIVVDSVSPTVYIINGETGSLNGWFDCSGHMKEPSDIAVKSDVPGNEYFICDFKGHCVVVFSEQGDYLRKIGHDGLTSYPNGIDISDDGDILVGDSHGNRFHVVVFDRNGEYTCLVCFSICILSLSNKFPSNAHHINR